MQRHESHIKGDATELRAMYEAVKRGWQLALPFFSALPYDIAILRNKKEGWLKIQCKAASNKYAANPTVNLTKRNGKNTRPYREGEFDFLFVLCESLGKCWLIPWKAVRGVRSTLTLNGRYDRYLI